MLSNREIRAKARGALGGKIFENAWLMGVVAVLVYLALSYVVGIVSTILIIFTSILVLCPLAIGLNFYFLKRAREDNPEISDMFVGFKNGYGENVLLGFMMGLFVFLWALLFIIPGIIKGFAYSMAYYIKLDHPEYGWKECLKESERMMKGKKLKLFGLALSFIGWAIVGVLCLGVGSLWVYTYEYTSIAVFYNELKAENEPIIAEL